MKPITGKGFTIPLCKECRGKGKVFKQDRPCRESLYDCDPCSGTGLAPYAVVDASTENGRIIAEYFKDEIVKFRWPNDTRMQEVYRFSWYNDVTEEYEFVSHNENAPYIDIPLPLIADKCLAREGDPVLGWKEGEEKHDTVYIKLFPKWYGVGLNYHKYIADCPIVYGMDIETLDRFYTWMGNEIPCPTCGGSGVTWDESWTPKRIPCPDCKENEDE